MQYRRFGRTEIDIPVFSCGGMRYQDGWKDKPLDEIGPENQANLDATIRRSVELGINHIETARGYGCSERQLGQVLPDLPRDQIIVQTKIAPHEDPKQFEDEFHDSLGRLKLDHVDLLAIHGINNRETLEWSIRDGGCFEAAQRLREQGKCEFVGFSTHGATDVILDAIRHGAPETGQGFDYVNLHWYFIFQQHWPAIEEARRRDMGVFIISPSDKGGKLYEPPAELVELCEPLSPIVFNDLFCLSRAEVHTLSIGASQPTDFDEHVKTLAYLDRADELLPPIIARLKQAMHTKAGMDTEAPFAVLPHWEDVPGEVNLQTMLWLRNLAVGWGMLDYGKMRYNLLGNGGHWFPGQNAASYDEEKVAAVVADSPLAEQLPDLVRETHGLLKGEEKKRQSEGG